MNAINIIFDGPPGFVTGRFVEVENDRGQSVSIGEWIERSDGDWALRITAKDILGMREGQPIEESSQGFHDKLMQDYAADYDRKNE